MKRPLLLCMLLSLMAVKASHAQDVALPEPVLQAPSEHPEKAELSTSSDREIDLANLVTSAAKGVTTVQEAPAIISIITSEEIKARGFRWMTQALGSIPGWLEIGALGDQVSQSLVRGVQQAALLLHDGISMFDPFANLAHLGRQQPIENLKRIEVVTGPGGVLWGANSFLGIVNLITKDAEDVNGIEVSAGYGDGPGNKQDIKAYALFGKTFFHNKLKIFQHISYENFIGQVYTLPKFIASSPAPQPEGVAFYGALTGDDPARSWMLTVDGKISLGPVSLYYMAPFGDIHPQLVFANAVVPNSTWNMWDRYAILEYKDRFKKDTIGVTVKGYWTQFVRNFDIQLFPPSSLFPAFNGPGGNPQVGGLHFGFPNQFVHRGGTTLDLDFNFKHGFRLLLGGEAFYEGINDSVESFSQQPYTGWSADAPGGSPASLPLICPQRQQADGSFTYVPNCPRQFINDVYRIVGAVYTDLQYRPIKQLALDAGVRVQKGFGPRPYDFTPLYSAALVWNIVSDYYLKLNYSTGFRPTVFTNTDGVAGGVVYGANQNLLSETSQSFQGEFNTRLLRNVRRVRDLEVRVDYSYTFLDRIITVHQGIFTNSGQRAIHSAEALARLYLQGDHSLQLAYTFLYSTSTDQGVIRALPNHWVSLGASFNLVRKLLDVNANLLVTGAYKDPNRYPSSPGLLGDSTTQSTSTDLTFDRLTPVANLQLGFRLRFLQERISLSGQFYNVLNQRYYMPDPFYDLVPSVELTPTPAPGFNFFASLSYRQ